MKAAQVKKTIVCITSLSIQVRWQCLAFLQLTGTDLQRHNIFSSVVALVWILYSASWDAEWVFHDHFIPKWLSWQGGQLSQPELPALSNTCNPVCTMHTHIHTHIQTCTFDTFEMSPSINNSSHTIFKCMKCFSFFIGITFWVIPGLSHNNKGICNQTPTSL